MEITDFLRFENVYEWGLVILFHDNEGTDVVIMGTKRMAIPDIFQLEINSNTKFMTSAFAGAFMHLTFLVVFLVVGIYTMAVFNIFSTLLYVTVGLLCTTGFMQRHPIVWISTMYGEICLHGVICTLLLGCKAMFYLYPVMTLSVAAYCLFLTCSGKAFKRGMTIMSMVTFVSVGGSAIFEFRHGAIMTEFMSRELSKIEFEVIQLINMLFNFFILLFFSILFVMEINSLIHKLNATNDRLNFIATHDALTGLFNRHHLSGRWAELKHITESCCVVMGDIDDFKRVNDTYGHDCGDVVLKSVSEIIMQSMGERDIACRWGGEEILMIMYGGREDCFAVIQRIKAQINALEINHEGRTVNVSMTFGFAFSGEDSNASLDELISTVDKRLYKGKASGKNVIIA